VNDEPTRSVVLVILGATAAWLWRSGAALNYIRPSLVPYLVVSAVILVLLGLLPPFGLLRWRPAVPREEGTGHGHLGARVGSLLIVPVLVVVLVQPAALGSYAVSGRSGVPGQSDSVFPPLAPPVRGAVPMTMLEFVTRALYDRSQSLADVRVRLVGFVAPGESDQGYRLTRFVISCCAADAAALQLVVHGDHRQWQRDQWLEVEGQWLRRPVSAANDPDPPLPVLTAEVVRPIPQPREPYE
jgi:uncharacterized repeat protein (TIGR03943 family)